LRQIAIGDIHGCLTALKALEASVPLGPDDMVITLGDYVDRGPDSKGVIDWLIARSEAGGLVALRGNHEIMMMRARDDPGAFHDWFECGGEAVLTSYGLTDSVDLTGDLPAEHWRFIEEETRAWFETETHFFVHANAYPDSPLEEQPDYMLYWGFEDRRPHESGKIMICGHTPQRSGHPSNMGHAVCIDTGACKGGWLTALDVESGRYWQSNEQGETRRGWLDCEDIIERE
jgi:serine/threonine protein phosphatase 1